MSEIKGQLEKLAVKKNCTNCKLYCDDESSDFYGWCDADGSFSDTILICPFKKLRYEINYESNGTTEKKNVYGTFGKVENVLSKLRDKGCTKINYNVIGT